MEINANNQPTDRRKALLKAGAWMIILGTGPLAIVGSLSAIGFTVSDNLVGLGLLSFLTLPIAIIVLIIAAFSPK